MNKIIIPIGRLPTVYKIRGLCFKLIDNILSNHFLEKKIFKKSLGYELNLAEPESFNQKVVRKKINDRNPLLPLVADKYRVRGYVKDVLGQKEAENILIPLLHVSTNPETISFDDLSEDYVIKTNHNSSLPIIIKKREKPDRKEIVSELKRQLRKAHGVMLNEWAYWPIERKVMVEEYLMDEEGKAPKDYKFYMFNGECKLIEVYSNRFTGVCRNIYDPNWKPLDVGDGFYSQCQNIPRPEKLDQMIYYSRELSNNFDFARIDLYYVNDKIYFGEITNYPGSGHMHFNKKFDFELGKKWKIEREYWKT